MANSKARLHSISFHFIQLHPLQSHLIFFIPTGIPSKVENWVEAIKKAEPEVNPMIIGSETRSTRNPSLSVPRRTCITPAMRLKVRATCAHSLPSLGVPSAVICEGCHELMYVREYLHVGATPNQPRHSGRASFHQCVLVLSP